MPWESRDAPSHTKEADTKKKKKLWRRVANEQLREHPEDEGRAIRIANYVVGRTKKNGLAIEHIPGKKLKVTEGPHDKKKVKKADLWSLLKSIL